MDYIKFKRKEIYFFIIMSLIFLLGLYLRLKALLLNICFQSDEVWIVKNFYKTYLELFLPLNDYQIAPVGFLFIEKFLYSISTNDMFMKMPSFLAGIATLAFFPVFASRFLKNKLLIILAYVMFAIHFPLIVYGMIMKSYIIDVFFTMVIIDLFMRIDVKKNSTKFLFIIGTLLGAIFWFSLSSIFIFISSLIAFIIYNYKDIKNKKIFYLLTPLAISLLFYFCWILIISNTLGAFMHNWWFVKEKVDRGYSLLNQIQKEFNLTYFFNTTEMSLIIKKFIYVIFVVIGILASKNKKSLYILLPIILMVVYHLLELYPIHLRLTLYIVPIFILILFIAIENITRCGRIILTLCVICIIIFQVKYLYSDSFPKLMNKDWIHGNSCTDAIEFVDIIRKNHYYNKSENFYLLFEKFNFFLNDMYIYHLRRGGVTNPIYIQYNYESFLEKIKKNNSCWIIVNPKYVGRLMLENSINIVELYRHKSYTKFEEFLIYIERMDND